MKTTVLLVFTALLLSFGVQAQDAPKMNTCTIFKVEKKDSCDSVKHCSFCKDIAREKKLAKVKGLGRTLPLPLDSSGCSKCKKNAPSKGNQKISHTM